MKKSIFTHWSAACLLASVFLSWASLSIRGAATTGKARNAPATDPRLDMVMRDQRWNPSRQLNWRRGKQLRNQEIERAELQQALTTSELQALKSQLHPHFLFNTLQGISALIDSDKTRAKAMVVKVSSLLRTALQYGSSDLISLDEELKFTEAYLHIEKMRLNGRLEVRWKIQPNTRHLLVPQLILQPLVENAIIHGIACSREGGWLDWITAL